MKNSTGLPGKLLGYILLIINILCALWLGLCYASSVTSPEAIKGISLFSLTTPFAIFANAVFIIIWLFSSRKLRLFFPLIMLALCYKLILQIVAFNFSGTGINAEDNTLKVMEWNVHGMGIFDGPHSNNGEKIMEVIKNESPDILCMAEYPAMYNDTLKPYSSSIITGNKFKEYRYRWDNGFGPFIWLGNAIFSKYPIIHSQYYELRPYIYLLECDVQLPHNKVVRLFTTHLSSFKLTDLDKKYIYDAKQKRVIDTKVVNTSKSYMSKFNAVYTIRAREADRIDSIIKLSPYPVMVCGDMNDLPASYVYNTIKSKLEDAFLVAGKGLGATYSEISPTLRIDHVFYDNKLLQAITYRSPHKHYSDHYPVIVKFLIK